MLALTHLPSPNLSQCELTHLARMPIDLDRALRQREAYCQALRDCGADVVTLTVNRDLPDSVFIEDTAIVLDEVAILTSMGTESRRAEPAGIEPELRKYREVVRIELPATIEGGDVLRVGRTLLVGLSARTNQAGAKALQVLTAKFGYRVIAIPIDRCLHLKTAVTALDDTTLLLNPAWVSAADLPGLDLVAVPVEEPWGANVARVGAAIVASAAHSRTADLIRRRGHEVHTVDLSEFAKAEGAVTCLSLLLATI